jgi:putative membrane protein
MVTDLVLAILHHIVAFALVGVLVAELVLIRPALAAETVKRLTRIDSAYGLLALALLAIGAARVVWGLRGWDYYSANPYFWAKIAFFLAVGLISIAPTMRFIAWNRQAGNDRGFTPPADEIARVRRMIHAQLGLLVLVMAMAATMARYA